MINRLPRTIEHIEKIMAMWQPAAVVGGVLSNARRLFSGHRAPEDPPMTPSE